MVAIEHIDGLLWTPVTVRPRCEKVVERYCQSMSIVNYLPLLQKVKRHQRRTVESLLPMFPGYIFVQLGRQESETLLLSHKIARIFRMDEGSEKKLISDLKSLQILEHTPVGTELTVAPELVTGTAVEVTEGPFQGMLGIVEKREKLTRVSVNVEMLGQSVSVELDVGELMPAE